MRRDFRALTAVAAVLTAMGGPAAALAQKQGGILRLSHFDSPASMSILEEATRAAEQPMMHVFNNLVMYQAGCAAKQPAIDHPGSGDELVVERGRNRIDLPVASGRQMARRQTLHRQ